MTALDASYWALAPYVDGWAGPERPPWVYGIWGVSLRGAHLEGAKLTSANLMGADLLLAHLENAFFFSARLDEAGIVRAHARGIRIIHCSANRAVFNNSDLTDAELVMTDFAEAQFGGTTLQRARLWQSNLEGVDLRLARLDGAMLYGAKLAKTRLRPWNLGLRVGEELIASGRQVMNYRASYIEAADVYRDLKTNFAGLGYYDYASWAHVKEKQMEKMTYRGLWRRNWPLRWISPVAYARASARRRRRLRQWLRLWITGHATRTAVRRWLTSWLYEALAGYGERPMLPLVWGAGLASILFPALYWAAGALQDNSLWNAIVFSLTTFGTLSFNRLQPVDTLGSILAAGEAFCGVLLFALFVFTLGNRMSRS